MTDDEGEAGTNQPRIHMSTGASDGFSDGNKSVTVTVEGGEGETTDDIEDVAKRRFNQAVDATSDEGEP